MKYIAAVFLYACLVSAVLADMTIVQKLQTDGMPVAAQNTAEKPKDSTMTMFVKGQKARIDLPSSEMSSIIDSKQGKMYTLIHKQKQVMVISLDDLKKGMALAKQAGKGDTKAEIKKTGKVAVIQGYKCAEYDFIGGGENAARIKCWITEEVDDSEMEGIRSFADQMGGMLGFNDVQKPKGMVIRAETIINLGGRDVTSRSEVMSIKRDPVADSLFVIPADYKTMEMPAFNPPPQPASAPRE